MGSDTGWERFSRTLQILAQVPKSLRVLLLTSSYIDRTVLVWTLDLEPKWNNFGELN